MSSRALEQPHSPSGEEVRPSGLPWAEGKFAGLVRRGSERAAPGKALGLPSLPAVEALLPDGGLPRGAVVELAAAGSGATSVALAACRAAQQEGQKLLGEPSFCAFIEAGRTLYAPALEQAGLVLERLLVLRPPAEALSRVALRVANSGLFSLVVVDLLSVPGTALDIPLGPWVRCVRQLAMAVQGSQCTVLLLTSLGTPRPLPLPVAQRIELERVGAQELRLSVRKERFGRLVPPTRVFFTNRVTGGAEASVVNL